jgi:hypothetical protein
MDLIESIFEISPDGGTGSTEALILTVLVGTILLFLQKFSLAQGKARPQK